MPDNIFLFLPGARSLYNLSLFSFQLIDLVTIDGKLRFACSMCGQHYGYRRNLLQHLKAKHSSQKYKCPYCDYTSGWSQQIKPHINNRHRDKIFK